MERFIQVLVDGWATGSLYGALAVAVVLIYRATGIVNFAQGELAMFSTFIAWGLITALFIPTGWLPERCSARRWAPVPQPASRIHSPGRGSRAVSEYWRSRATTGFGVVS